MTARRTSYQRTHFPAKRVEILCASRAPLTRRGFCPDCHRHLRRPGRDHHPGWTGLFGWTEHYGDGSTRQTPPDTSAQEMYELTKSERS